MVELLRDHSNAKKRRNLNVLKIDSLFKVANQIQPENSKGEMEDTFYLQGLYKNFTWKRLYKNLKKNLPVGAWSFGGFGYYGGGTWCHTPM